MDGQNEGRTMRTAIVMIPAGTIFPDIETELDAIDRAGEETELLRLPSASSDGLLSITAREKERGSDE